MKNTDANTDELAALRAEVETLRAKVAEYESSPVVKRMPGWLLQSKSQRYNGTTAGIRFRGGQAFVPDTGANQHEVEVLCRDFGYSMTYVNDFMNIPAAAEMSKTMVDFLPAQHL